MPAPAIDTATPGADERRLFEEDLRRTQRAITQLAGRTDGATADAVTSPRG